MKTYLKTLWRMFRRHVTRFASIIFIVLISVGFISGVGTAADKIRYSLNDYYKSANVSDFIIKDATGNGFSDEDVRRVGQILGVPSQNVSAGSCFDVNAGTEEQPLYVRLYFVDFYNWYANIPQLIRGEMPQSKYFALCERGDNKLKELAVGQKFTLDFKDILKRLGGEEGQVITDRMSSQGNMSPEVTVGGIVQSPLTFGLDGEPSYFTDENIEIPTTTDGVNSLPTLLSYVLYLSVDLLPTYADSLPDLPEWMFSALGVDPHATVLPKTSDIYALFEDRNLFSTFSADYKSEVDGKSEEIESAFGNVRVITLYQNYSFTALDAYAQKVLLIGVVLMVAFLFVTVLVVLSTMTRLLEEERPQIACLSTLGYSPIKIIFKYLLFAAIATGVGGFIGYFVGDGVSELLYIVFGYSFAMPPSTGKVALLFYLAFFGIIVLATLGTTLFAGRKMTADWCANLLRPKPPRAGQKTVIEKIPFIWNKLSFKYKSTTRNVLRYKKRFVMTVVSVAISMALVMAGITILDLCLFHGVNSPSIMAVAVVIVAFAGLLTAVVIYTLTNINISERTRELSTLMVLGYYDGEVAGYIFREIYIDTVVGIIFGYPASALIMYVLFGVMSLGSFSTVSWFVWLIAPLIILLFTALVTVILRRKIVRIDMNDSLKAIE